MRCRAEAAKNDRERTRGRRNWVLNAAVLEEQEATHGLGVTGTCARPWSRMGHDRAVGDFPHLQRKVGCRANPACGCCYRAAGCPAAGGRKAECAAEANSDRPSAVQCRGSSGNVGPPELLTSDFPSCSSPAPKDRRYGTDTLCFPPDMLRAMHTHMCVRNPPLQHWLGTSTLVPSQSY